MSSHGTAEYTQLIWLLKRDFGQFIIVFVDFQRDDCGATWDRCKLESSGAGNQ